MIMLDVNEPNVSSATSIVVDVGVPGTKMLVCSGIAIPEWSVHDDGTIYKETAVVNLRQTVLAVEQATVTVGLASIGNGKTNFQFAVDSSGLDVDTDTQNLILTVEMSLMGDPSALDRFGYQVVALITTQTTGISGTIAWTKDVFDATGLDAAALAQLFTISAGTSQYIPAPVGKGFGTTVYTPLAYGVSGALSTTANGFALSYDIPGAPYNVPMIVTVDATAQFKTGLPNVARQISGPNPVVLTVSNPGVRTLTSR